MPFGSIWFIFKHAFGSYSGDYAESGIGARLAGWSLPPLWSHGCAAHGHAAAARTTYTPPLDQLCAYDGGYGGVHGDGYGG